MKWSEIDAALFDLDGVITPTAIVHMHAWSQMFNRFLESRGIIEPYTDEDYYRYVDGKPRYEGVRSFLESRGIDLPEGRLDDGPSQDSVFGLGQRKNEAFQQVLDEEGVIAYPGSVRLIELLSAQEIPMAVVSSSQNAPAVLEAADLLKYFPVIVDGVVAQQRHLAGKPAPDTFLDAARQLEVEPARAAVLEDALSGVAAGRAGRFGLVIGVDRGAGAEALMEHGADQVVSDLEELL